jgi:ribosomal protein L31
MDAEGRREKVEVCLVTIDKAGHVLYPGAETDIDTARLAWEFMKRFKK